MQVAKRAVERMGGIEMQYSWWQRITNAPKHFDCTEIGLEGQLAQKCQHRRPALGF